MITIAEPASDRALVSVDAVKNALGITGSAEDAELENIIARVSDQISRACGVAEAAGSPPTLLAEEVVETFRLPWNFAALVLARRFVAEVASVVVAGETLTADDFEVEASAGLLYRLAADMRCRWPSSKIVVTYTAGFDDVPEDLQMAAIMAVQDSRAVAGADPLVKREKVDDVSEQEFFYALNTGALSQRVLDLLAPYSNARCFA